MIEFLKTRNELYSYINTLKDRGYWHPEDMPYAGIKVIDNRILFFVRSNTIKNHILEVEAPSLDECLNLIKKELKWQ